MKQDSIFETLFPQLTPRIKISDATESNHGTRITGSKLESQKRKKRTPGNFNPWWGAVYRSRDSDSQRWAGQAQEYQQSIPLTALTTISTNNKWAV